MTEEYAARILRALTEATEKDLRVACTIESALAFLRSNYDEYRDGLLEISEDEAIDQVLINEDDLARLITALSSAPEVTHDQESESPQTTTGRFDRLRIVPPAR